MNIKSVCKQHRDNPKECIAQLRELKPTPSIVGQWAFYAASIGYYEVFRACANSVGQALQARRSEEYTASGLLMNACVGGHPQIVECVARAYIKDIPDTYKVVEHCANLGKKDILDVLLKLGEEFNVYSWKSDRVIRQCFKSHQNAIALEYLNTYKDHIQGVGSWVVDCCIMGNTEGLGVLHDFCKVHPHIKWSSNWKRAVEDACKNQRVEMLDFLLNDGLKLFAQDRNTSFFEAIAIAAYWARCVSTSHPQKSQDMFNTLFKNVPFETWRHAVKNHSMDDMEQRYAQYLRTTLEENIDPTNAQPNRRKI